MLRCFCLNMTGYPYQIQGSIFSVYESATQLGKNEMEQYTFSGPGPLNATGLIRK